MSTDIIEVRPCRSKSWLDRSYSHVLAAQLTDRLVHRCRGQKGLFLTLTYRRSDYSGPADLYRLSSEHRHVRRFIESLSRYLGQSLTSRWLCKLEFQRGGWVHYHIILLDVNCIDHSALSNIWGHGYVWINRLTSSRIRYACKYISKGESLPAFLYNEPIRSVKIVRVSPGFWGDTADSGGGGIPPTDPPSSKLSGCYVPIGMSIELQENSTIIRDKDGKYEKRSIPTWQLVIESVSLGYTYAGTDQGWIKLRRPRHRTNRSGHCPPGVRAASRSEALHLTNNRKPPIGFAWLDQYFKEMFSCPNLNACGGGV